MQSYYWLNEAPAEVIIFSLDEITLIVNQQNQCKNAIVSLAIKNEYVIGSTRYVMYLAMIKCLLVRSNTKKYLLL